MDKDAERLIRASMHGDHAEAVRAFVDKRAPDAATHRQGWVRRRVPGDRFSEAEIGQRVGVSRTPVIQRKLDVAHIEQSMVEVRKISLHAMRQGRGSGRGVTTRLAAERGACKGQSDWT